MVEIIGIASSHLDHIYHNPNNKALQQAFICKSATATIVFPGLKYEDI
jgi:dsRNA-specific ribonuclease